MMYRAIMITLMVLAIIVFAAVERYIRAWRMTGNSFGLIAASVCIALGLWLLYSAYWLGSVTP